MNLQIVTASLRSIFEALFDSGETSVQGKEVGITEIIGQGRNVRVAKFEPRESVQMRMARIYKGIQYRPMTKNVPDSRAIRGFAGIWSNEL